MKYQRKIPDFPFRIFSIDPGKNTGLARSLVTEDFFEVEETRVTLYMPDQERSPVNDLTEWSRTYNDMKYVLLYENFHVRPRRNATDTTALLVIGAIEKWAESQTKLISIIKREPVQGELAITDDILKRMGILGRGGLTRHSNDAIRHAVSWLSSRRHRPVCEMAWGRP